MAFRRKRKGRYRLDIMMIMSIFILIVSFFAYMGNTSLEDVLQDKYGNILINDIRTIFKSFNHPLVQKGQKSEREIYFEFLECLNIFKNYRCNVNQQYNIDCLNYGAFLEFFKEISFSIADNEIFKGILINCFGIDNINEE